MFQTFGVATALLDATDAGTLITAITDEVVANLPFIAAIVAFSIIGGMVLHKIRKPLGKR